MFTPVAFSVFWFIANVLYH